MSEAEHTPRQLTEVAADCVRVIQAAEADGLQIDSDNVVDLCADNVRASLSDIRSALVIAGHGYGKRFVAAIARYHT